MKRLIPILMLLAAFMAPPIAPAQAITAELAKQCRELMVKAYPKTTAGAKEGTAKAERDYFEACIAKDGKMDVDKTEQPAQSPPPKK
jgi:hypothetical protein